MVESKNYQFIEKLRKAYGVCNLNAVMLEPTSRADTRPRHVPTALKPAAMKPSQTKMHNSQCSDDVNSGDDTKKPFIRSTSKPISIKTTVSQPNTTKPMPRRLPNKPAGDADSQSAHPLKSPPLARKTTSTAAEPAVCPGVADNVCQCLPPISQSVQLMPGADNKSVPHSSAPVDQQRSWLTSKRIVELRQKAIEAAKRNKTFTIRGCFYAVRRGLLMRGWVERLDVHRRQTGGASASGQHQLGGDEIPDRKPGESTRVHILKCERNIMSRFLEHKPIDFLWACRKERTDWVDMQLNAAMRVSRFHKKPFTSKSGMCSVLRDFHWFFEEGTAEMYFPRCYNAFNADDLDEFVENFRLSACVAMLRLAVERPEPEAASNDECLESAAAEAAPDVPVSSVRFAIDQCRQYLRFRQHDDIDDKADALAAAGPRSAAAVELAWEQLQDHHQQLASGVARLAADAGNRKMLETARSTLADVAAVWPQYNLDGWHNIWIVKPSNRCRGRGIRLMNDLRKIRELVGSPASGRWVVQKYIERPLIIHNCKFDIRQWFLVTSVQPMIIWMYRDSYLRFSTQQFSLLDLHESVHLTNHAVQKRYRTNRQRDARLPADNMWDSDTFQTYLRQIGAPNVWTDRIYAGMRRALVGTMLASQDSMDRRVNTFELFGADFMVTEDYQPWLLEINSSPDLAASTSVTSRLCPQCLDDVVKVVVDHRANPKASTGQFELVYKQQFPCSPSYLGLELYLTGTQLLPKVSRRDSRPTITTNHLPKPTASPRKRIAMPKQPFAMEVFQPTDKIKPSKASSKPAVSFRSAIPSSVGSKRPIAAMRIESTRLRVFTKRPLTSMDYLPKGGRRYRASVAKSSATSRADTNTDPMLAITSAAVLRSQKRQMQWGSRGSLATRNIWRELELLRSKEDMRCVGKSCALPTITGGGELSTAMADEGTKKMPSERATSRPSRSMSNLLDVAAAERNGRRVDEFMREWRKKTKAGMQITEANRNKTTMSART